MLRSAEVCGLWHTLVKMSVPSVYSVEKSIFSSGTFLRHTYAPPEVSTYTDERGKPVYAARQPFGHLAMIGT